MSEQQAKEIFCCGCQTEIKARLTNGQEAYPHRKDLYSLPFWICDSCGNFVGCHHKTNNPTNPLGIIPTKELKNARRHIHKLLDPIWESGRMKRGVLYAKLTEKLGYPYHTANIRSVDEARKVYKLIKRIAAE